VVFAGTPRALLEQQGAATLEEAFLAVSGAPA